MHLTAEVCPHCGMDVDVLDAIYDGMTIDVRRPHDCGGVLRVKERRQVAKWISKAERRFPQLFFSVVTCSLKGEQNLRSYGFWLMNRGRFEDVSEGARGDGGVMLVIDVNRKEVCLVFGYLLDGAVEEKEAFDALLGGHPYLLESEYLRAIECMLSGVVGYVKKLRKKLRKQTRV